MNGTDFAGRGQSPRPVNNASSHPESGITSAALKEAARSIGFDLVGITPAASPTTFSRFKEWLDSGHAGEMGYLSRRLDAYDNPDRVLEGIRSVVMLGMNYAPPRELDQQQGLKIARYARGKRDYHDLIRERLKELSRWIKQRIPNAKTRGIVDTAPLLERDFARQSGLGWFGKNTMLINKRMGSYFFLAALLTDLPLDPDPVHETSHCGTCTRCLEACPTDAFVAPYVLDARRCISYLTIELKGEIPHDLREGMGDWMFGCDICQEVCPWNRKSPPTPEPDFLPLDGCQNVTAAEMLKLSEAEFQQRFGATPLARPGREGILRNVAIAAGNSGSNSDREALVDASKDESEIIREAAEWGVEQIEEKRI